MCVMKVEGLTAGYGRVPVIFEIALEARVSQVVAIVGPNGAGKSTAMKATFGLVERNAGKVLLDEQDISHLLAHEVAHAGMAYVPQVENVFAAMSVEENLELGAFVNRRNLAGRRAEVFDIFPDLAVARRRKAGQLSGGQRNMLGMARALMSDPKVILLDEPTTGMDAATHAVVVEALARLSEGRTTLMVTHHLASVRDVDSITVMDRGRIVEHGTHGDLVESSSAYNALLVASTGAAPGA